MPLQANECPLKELPLERFTWKDGVLSAYESDLRNRSYDGHFDFMGRLWNDACDTGIAIRSNHTGKVERFYLEKTDKDGEGDVAGWWFKPVDRKSRVKQVLVIND